MEKKQAGKNQSLTFDVMVELPKDLQSFDEYTKEQEEEKKKREAKKKEFMRKRLFLKTRPFVPPTYEIDIGVITPPTEDSVDNQIKNFNDHFRRVEVLSDDLITYKESDKPQVFTGDDKVIFGTQMISGEEEEYQTYCTPKLVSERESESGETVLKYDERYENQKEQKIFDLFRRKRTNLKIEKDVKPEFGDMIKKIKNSNNNKMKKYAKIALVKAKQYYHYYVSNNLLLPSSVEEFKKAEKRTKKYLSNFSTSLLHDLGVMSISGLKRKAFNYLVDKKYKGLSLIDKANDRVKSYVYRIPKKDISKLKKSSFKSINDRLAIMEIKFRPTIINVEEKQVEADNIVSLIIESGVKSFGNLHAEMVMIFESFRLHFVGDKHYMKVINGAKLFYDALKSRMYVVLELIKRYKKPSFETGEYDVVLSVYDHILFCSSFSDNLFKLQTLVSRIETLYKYHVIANLLSIERQRGLSGAEKTMKTIDMLKQKKTEYKKFKIHLKAMNDQLLKIIKDNMKEIRKFIDFKIWKAVSGTNEGKRFYTASTDFSVILYRISKLIWSPERVTVTVTEEETVEKKVETTVKTTVERESLFVEDMRKKQNPVYKPLETDEVDIQSNVTLFEHQFILLNEMTQFIQDKDFKKQIITSTIEKVLKNKYTIAKNMKAFFLEQHIMASCLQKISTCVHHYVKLCPFISYDEKLKDVDIYDRDIVEMVVTTSFFNWVGKDKKLTGVFKDIKILEGLEYIMSKLRVTFTEKYSNSLGSLFHIQLFYNALIYGSYNILETDIVKDLMRMYEVQHTLPVLNKRLINDVDVEKVIRECAFLYAADDKDEYFRFIGECRYLCYYTIEGRDKVFLIGLIWYLLKKSSTILERSKDRLKKRIALLPTDPEISEFSEFMAFEEKSVLDNMIQKYAPLNKELDKIVKAKETEVPFAGIRDKARVKEDDLIILMQGLTKEPREKKINRIRKELKDDGFVSVEAKPIIPFYSVSDFAKENYFSNLDTPFDKENLQYEVEVLESLNEELEKKPKDVKLKKTVEKIKRSAYIHSILISFVKNYIFKYAIDTTLFEALFEAAENNPFVRLILRVYFNYVKKK
jgi:hypothetical protein